MEKYSKATQDFASAFAETKPEIINEKLASEELEVSDVVVYGHEKVAQVKIKEDFSTIKLFEFLMESYGTEWISWTPETIRKTVLDSQANEVVENKIQAIATCLSTDTPWQEWHIFENVGKAFNHQVPNFGLIQPLSLGECWATMKIMDHLREEDWSNEVLLYIAAIAHTSNIVYMPTGTELEKVQDFLDGYGTDVDLKMKTSESWSKIKDRNVLDSEFNDTPVQVQLAKLAVVQQYMKENTEI